MKHAPPLPDLVIGGAQRSGTTALHHLLASHPDIYFPVKPQEIHFFDLDVNYARGMDWYRSCFKGWRGEALVGQTSPLYLFDPRVPLRLHAALPDARLIFVLRQPVDRAYSHYWHEVRWGVETHSFEEALELEPERLRQGFDAWRDFSYLTRGQYSEQLQRYYDRFSREQILVVPFDQLSHAAGDLFRGCCDFLGLPVPASGPPVARKYNASRQPRSHLLQRWVVPWRRHWPRIGRLVDLVNLRLASYPAMREDTRRRLQAHFEPEIERLEELTGLDLSLWRSPERGEEKA